MMKCIKKLIGIIKWIFIVLILLVLLILLVRFIGMQINKITPSGGINEEMYIDVNGTKQWISIYGKDKSNPVMLYVHGGPGIATSGFDYPVLRKLADDYTVVNWDQRGSGKSQMKYPFDGYVTPELLREDIYEVAKYVLDKTGKEKLTILGSSWGTLYGGDFALSHPELVECYIGTSQVVDYQDICIRLKESALEWSKDDEVFYKLVESYDPYVFSQDEIDKSTAIRKKYCQNDNILKDGDFNILAAMFFNPYYSLKDLYDYIKVFTSGKMPHAYEKFLYDASQKTPKVGSIQEFSLKDRTEYPMPVYIRMGSKDYQSNPDQPKEYFDIITAPDKEFEYVDGGHFMPFIDSEGLAAFVHKVRERSASY